MHKNWINKDDATAEGDVPEPEVVLYRDILGNVTRNYFVVRGARIFRRPLINTYTAFLWGAQFAYTSGSRNFSAEASPCRSDRVVTILLKEVQITYNSGWWIYFRATLRWRENEVPLTRRTFYTKRDVQEAAWHRHGRKKSFADIITHISMHTLRYIRSHTYLLLLTIRRWRRPSFHDNSSLARQTFVRL